MLKQLFKIRFLGRTAESIACLGLILGTLSASSAHAALVGDTREPFTAERTLTIKGKTYVGQMWAMPGEQRHDQMINGLHLVAIIRADRRVIWVMVPEFHAYAELPLQQSWLDYAQTQRLAQPVSTAPIDGMPANEYRLQRREQDGSAFDGDFWLTMANILMKFDGVYVAPQGHRTPIAFSIAHMERGPQDPSLFELPHGMSKLPAQALQPLLGIKG